jgi:hypothetical protein
MSLNLLSTVSGLVKALHINDLISALVGSFVGRNSSGAVEAGQNLGTLLYPWGKAYINDLVYNGISVASDVFQSSRNRIVSGQTRTTSNQPDFIRASGTTNAFTIKASSSVPLKLVINDVEVEITSDIAVTGLTTAPGSNNTMQIVSANLNDQYYSEVVGENNGYIYSLSSVGSEIYDQEALFMTLKTPNNEIVYGRQMPTNAGIVGTLFGDVRRGYFLDDSGVPIQRGGVANNDVWTLMSTGWIFIQDNGVTVDVSYIVPIVSGTEPTTDLGGNSLQDGQYWLDNVNQTWKRYSSTSSSFQTLNRILIGLCVIDGTNCIATRSLDFNKDFQGINTYEMIQDFQQTPSGWSYLNIIRTRSTQSVINVYGNEINSGDNHAYFDLSTDMATGVSLTASTEYYLYVTDEGVNKISDVKPQKRDDLKGYYHPHETWRSVGNFYYDSTPEIDGVHSLHESLSLPLLSTKNGSSEIDFQSFPLKTAIYKIPIGPWDMDADTQAQVTIDAMASYLRINDTNIKSIDAWIINDAQNAFTPIGRVDTTTGVTAGYCGLGTTPDGSANGSLVINILRVTGGYFDDVAFDDTSINRGFVYIEIEV